MINCKINEKPKIWTFEALLGVFTKPINLGFFSNRFSSSAYHQHKYISR